MVTWFFVPLGLILPDQPNRVVRTRTLRGVGGGSCEAPPYPDSMLNWFLSFLFSILVDCHTDLGISVLELFLNISHL